MDKANYEKAVKNEDDSTIVEKKLTTDGIENFSYGDSFNETNVDREKNKNKRKTAFLYWSPDAKHFVMIKSDQRKVKDLWVINSIAEPRPTLETYKYQMPGEKEAPIDHVYLFDMVSFTNKEMTLSAFKDQSISIWADPGKINMRDDDFRVSEIRIGIGNVGDDIDRHFGERLRNSIEILRPDFLMRAENNE